MLVQQDCKSKPFTFLIAKKMPAYGSKFLTKKCNKHYKMDCFVTKYDPLVAKRFLIYYNKNLVKESVAQLAEQWTVDPRVAGSTPVALPML